MLSTSCQQSPLIQLPCPSNLIVQNLPRIIFAKILLESMSLSWGYYQRPLKPVIIIATQSPVPLRYLIPSSALQRKLHSHVYKPTCRQIQNHITKKSNKS